MFEVSLSTVPQLKSKVNGFKIMTVDAEKYCSPSLV